MKTKILFIFAIASIFIACTKTNPNLVTISGKVINPKGEAVGFIGKDTTYSTTLNEDGTFELTFSLDSSKYLDFDHGPEQTAMYVYPGDKIKLSIDPAQFDESIRYEGSATSTFLAKKYLMRENADFLGKVYYMSSSEEYKSFLEEYKTSLIAEFGGIKDSTFIKNEISNIDKSIAYYVKRQDELSEYGKDVREYMMERADLNKKFNFYAALDSLNSIEFDTMLKDYAKEINELLGKVTDEEFAAKASEGMEGNVAWWSERKTLTDNRPKAGENAIDFIYPDTQGTEISLSSFKGSLVYVDVWATWCGPCIAQIPALQKLEKEYHGKNIIFLSVSVDTDKDAWVKMVEEEELGGVQIWAGGWKGITQDYAIFGIPRFMLFSADGKIISVDAPRPTSSEIRGLLDSNL